MILFKIGNTDYTSHITSEKDFNVEREEITYEWEDGFGGKHIKPYNTQIKGSFDMFFATSTDYTAFLNAVNAAKVHNALPCRLFVRNIAQEVDTHVYVKISVKKFQSLIGNNTGFVATIKVDEAAVYA